VSHFATLSDLASLILSAVAGAALQARETSDSGGSGKPTSVVGSPGASSIQSSPAASDQTGASSVQSSPAASDQTGASSVQSSPAASDQTGASSIQSSPAASDQTGAAAAAKSSSGLSLGTSDSTENTTGVTNSTSTGSNQTLLYGPDSRPNITHLAASMSTLLNLLIWLTLSPRWYPGFWQHKQ